MSARRVNRQRDGLRLDLPGASRRWPTGHGQGLRGLQSFAGSSTRPLPHAVRSTSNVKYHERNDPDTGRFSLPGSLSPEPGMEIVLYCVFLEKTVAQRIGGRNRVGVDREPREEHRMAILLVHVILILEASLVHHALVLIDIEASDWKQLAFELNHIQLTLIYRFYYHVQASSRESTIIEITSQRYLLSLILDDRQTTLMYASPHLVLTGPRGEHC